MTSEGLKVIREQRREREREKIKKGPKIGEILPPRSFEVGGKGPAPFGECDLLRRGR